MSAAVAPAPTSTSTTYQAESSSSSSNLKFMTGVLTSPPVVTLTAYIPTAAVGAVIGRRGQNVEDLQRRAAQSATTRQPVRVSVVGHDSASSSALLSPTSPSFGGATEGVPSASTTTTTTTTTTPSSSSLPYTYSALDFSDPAWTPVVIRADVEAAMAAGRGLSDACNGKLDQVVLDVPLTRHRHASIIGQFGRTIAKLSADHDVRIMVPHKESRMDLIQLEGDLENVASCLMEILRIASRHGNSNNNNNSNNPNNKQQRDDSSLPADSLTVATAPTQTKIRNIAKKTGTTIKKKKSEGNTATWELTVTGKTTDQVASAMALLRKWRDEGGDSANNNNNNAAAAQGRKGKQGGGGRGRQNNNNNKGTPKRSGGKNNNSNNNAPRTPSASSENN